MELQFASRMKEYEEGIFQVLNEIKNDRIKEGKKVYNFSVGTPDFKPAQHIMDAVVNAAKNPDNYKYALEDIPELTEAVTGRYKKRYGVTIEADELMSVYGSQEGIAHIGLSLCDEGDVVLVPNPGYPIFAIGPSLANATIATYDLIKEHDYLPDLEGMDKELLKKVKFMIVSYPINPICKIAPKSFYERLIPWAKENEIIIIHDNAYSDIVYDGNTGISILSIPGAKEVCVEFYSLSKSYNYTGARVSFLVGNKAIVQNFKKLRSQIDYGTFLPVQYGAAAALNGPDDSVLEQCDKYQARRDALCGGLREIGWQIPDSEGTMFAWGPIPEQFTDDVAFVKELVDKTGVLCTPGSSFGELGAGHVRFALTLPVGTIQEAIAAIKSSGILFKK
ncbi:MAG: aminotransferase class I/II-fold pyridoxal phosphate-dependent enzyme [Lachnospiraceae bacterium]|nr:aminotransferase class I/II-fold pyridoxal phosphate-dependent enzyme [Lachnospiraceae bacterium]